MIPLKRKINIVTPGVFSSICQSPDHQADNGTRCNRGQHGITRSVIIDPVMAMRRVIQVVIGVIGQDDGVVMIGIMPANMVTRDVSGPVIRAM
jgi:hypothetical protein